MPAKNKVILINGNSCNPEVEERWQKWYLGTHIPMVLEFEGVKGATRYKITGNTEGGKYPEYISVFQFDSLEDAEAYEKSPEYEAAIRDFEKTWKDKGHQRKWRVYYEEVANWEK